MDFITPAMPKEVEEYLQEYDKLFVRQEQKEHFRYYIAGMISETMHKNVQQVMAKVVAGRYQSGHHFLAESPWQAEEVNKQRLDLWQADKMTAMRVDGWWIQDDTGQQRRIRGKEKQDQEKRLTGGTDGAASQYIGNVGKTCEGIVFVSTQYADEEKRLPITADLFWPEEARQRLPEAEQTDKRQWDKIAIAIEQLKWSKENITGAKPRRVLSDAWYGSSPRYLNAINDELRYNYIVKIRPNRTIFCRLGTERGAPAHSAEEVIPYLKTNDYKKVLVECEGGRTKTKWIAEVNAKINVKVKGLKHRPLLFLCVDDPSRINIEEADFLLCNDRTVELAEVMQAYHLRNWEEVFYRQGKDQLGLDQCEAQMEERLLRHWALVMVAWTMVESFRIRGDLIKRGQRPDSSFDSVLQFLRNVFRWDFWNEWLQDPERVKIFVRWFCTTKGLGVSFS